MKKTFHFVLFCNILLSHFSQQNFQKIYPIDENFAVFNDVFVTDSCYYYTCNNGWIEDRTYFNFGKISLDGSEEMLLFEQDTLLNTQVAFRQADMDTNFRGNFVICYPNVTDLSQGPHIKELSKTGQIIAEYTLNNYWVDEHLEFFEGARLIVNNADSTYFMAFQYYDNYYSNSTNGVFLVKLKYDGTILWDKRLSYLPLGPYNPAWILQNILALSDNRFVLVVMERDQSWLNITNWTKLHYIIINQNGNELDHKIYQQGQFCPVNFGSTSIPDGGFIQSIYESFLDTTSPNNPYFRPRPQIIRLDSNMNLLWKRNLNNFYGEGYGDPVNMNDIKIYQDSLIVGAYCYVEEIEKSQDYVTTARICQYNLDGQLKWARDYVYFPTDGFNDPEYSIYDLELTPDGGFIMAGYVESFDSIPSFQAFQFGYILKTNCLGFLGDAKANFNYYIDSNYKVIFENKSTEAGSYTWIFKEGEILRTVENMDSVSFTFPSHGSYFVTLVAHGCNGHADTICREVIVPGSGDEDTTSQEIASDFRVFPSPVGSSESFAIYVGNINPDSPAELRIVNEKGDIAKKYSAIQKQTTYILNPQLTPGVYFLTLSQKNKIIQREKMIVQ